MTDKELILRALLGDKRAQQECTRREIVLPCPKCGKGKIIFWDKKMKWYSCWDCGMKSGPKKSFGEALRDWNTRPAPPVGRCRDCVWSREPTKEDYAEIGRDVLAYKDSLVCDFCEDARWKDDFCSYFKAKEEQQWK